MVFSKSQGSAVRAESTKSDCVVVGVQGSKSSSSDVEVFDPKIASSSHEAAKKRKKNYEFNRHFQDSWAAKLPWAEAVIGSDGRVTQVRCKVCSEVEEREKLLVPKIDSLWKHAGRQKALADMGKIRRGEHYYLGSCQHVKNERIYFAKGGDTVVQQLQLGVSKEHKLKIVQMKCLFNIMKQGRPMCDYSTMEGLLQQLNLPQIPKKHWSKPLGWDFAYSMANVCSNRLSSDIAKVNYISLSADEVTACDNQQWSSVHIYYCVNFRRESHMLSIQRVRAAATAKNLTMLIIEQLHFHGLINLDSDYPSRVKFFAEKLISFGAYGAAIFQGSKAGVIQRLKEEFAPYVIGIHDFAHQTDLAVEALSNLPVVSRLENLCKSLYQYFSCSSKCHLEFTKLAKVVETEGLKILNKVDTRWISLLEPLKRISGEYKTLIVKLGEDQERIAQRNLSLLCDLFTDVVNNHSYTISQEWVMDLNKQGETLSFRINGHTYRAHSIDPLTGGVISVGKDDFQDAIRSVKGQCSAAELLISQLDKRFSNCDIMEALGITFPQFWLQESYDEFFPVHLATIKTWFCTTKYVTDLFNNVLPRQEIGAPLDAKLLDIQTSLFKMTMRSQAPKAMENLDSMNPMTKMWQKLGCNALLLSKLSEYMKLAEIAITTVLGSCEDEKTFSTLAFMKNRLRNQLGGGLDTCIRLYGQDWWTLESFPYADAYENWRQGQERIAVNH